MRRLSLGMTLLLALTNVRAFGAQGEQIPAIDSSPQEPRAETFVERTQELIMHALAFTGVRYKWGGNTPETGLDCSGYVRFVFQEAVGVMLPHDAYSMSLIGKTIRRPELRPGDLVFFNTLKRAFSHVGIYLGENRFIHAPRSGKRVEIGDMSSDYWAARFNGARRVLDSNPS